MEKSFMHKKKGKREFSELRKYKTMAKTSDLWKLLQQTGNSSIAIINCYTKTLK